MADVISCILADECPECGAPIEVGSRGYWEYEDYYYASISCIDPTCECAVFLKGETTGLSEKGDDWGFVKDDFEPEGDSS